MPDEPEPIIDTLESLHIEIKTFTDAYFARYSLNYDPDIYVSQEAWDLHVKELRKSSLNQVVKAWKKILDGRFLSS